MNIHQIVSPKYFFYVSGKQILYLGSASLLMILSAAWMGLFVAPPDYQQGDSYRIMFIHVPSAWMSLMIYVLMALSGLIGLVWRIRLAEDMASACAPIGAAFTALTLVTGSLWGKPMWGAWWVWDARLTSELILLFLYLGFISLESSMNDPRTGTRAASVLAIVGVINIPIIHFSVEWWNTLHQGPTVSKLGAPAIHASMLWPLLLMAGGFLLYVATVLLLRVRCKMLARKQQPSLKKILEREYS